MSMENSSGIRHWKKYPEYKDSGVEWLGIVPEGWEINNFRNACTFHNGRAYKLDEWENEGIPVIRLQNLTGKNEYYYSKLKLPSQQYCDHNDLLYMWSASFGPYFWTGEKAIFHYHIWKVVPIHKKFDKKFLFYKLEEITVQMKNQFTNGGIMPHITKDMMEKTKIALPPYPEQTAIATFLDHEMTRINALISKKERQIELLNERSVSLTSNAVTKGLNLNARMKNSGIEWIGEVPEHWKIIKTKYLFKLTNEKAPNDNSFDLISVYSDIGVKPRKELEARGNKASTTDGYTIVKKGDIIVNKLLAWMGAIGYSNYDGVTSPAYDILRKKVELNSKFYDYLFRCGIYLPEFQRRSRGIMDMRWRLYFEELGQIPVVYPDLVEQDKIVAYIDRKTAIIDAFKEKIQQSINLTKEYRTSLISAAVTGKIDVRNEVKA